MIQGYTAKLCFVMLSIIGMCFSSSSFAAIFQVANSSQLQSAIAAAQQDGTDDTIRIAQGNYSGNFIYSSHASGDLTIEGGWDGSFTSRQINAKNTVLDGNQNGNVFVFSCDQPVNLKIDGITFQNGLIQTGNDGAGIYISIIGYDWVLEDNSISIENSIIANNSVNVTTHASGIGIYIWTHADVVLKNNTITANRPTDESNDGSSTRGGGICIHTSETVDIIGNTITRNEAGSGGGLYLETNYLGVRILNNTIRDNSAEYAGGGLYAYTPSLDNPTLITGNIFSNNSAARYGGGIYLKASGEQYTITNNQLTGNTASWTGGGVFIQSDSFTNYYQTIDFVNNTIAYNEAGRNGGGLYVMMQGDSVTQNIYNNIFWQNSSTNPGFDLYLDNDFDNNFLAGIINLYNNDFNQSGWGIYWDIPSAVHSSNLNDRDPLFVSARKENYTLGNGSPCLNTGTNQAPQLPSTDLLGSARIQQGIVDMGAYEGPHGSVEPLRVMAPIMLLLNDK